MPSEKLKKRQHIIEKNMQHDTKNLEGLLSANGIHISTVNRPMVRDLALGIWDAAHKKRRRLGCREMYEAGLLIYRRRTDTDTLLFIRGVLDAGRRRCNAEFSLSYSMGYALGKEVWR